MRKKVICLENMPYQSPIRVGSHHYAEHFSREYDVLWISLPWHIPQLIKNADNARYRHFNGGRPVAINDHLKALVPFTLIPYRRGFGFGSGFIVDHYYTFMMPRINGLLKRYGFKDVELLWFSDPRHLSILRHLRTRKLAYRCVDNLEHFADVPKSLAPKEADLIQRSDAVFFTSRQLLEKNRHLNSNVEYLPNGADYEFFASGHANAELPRRLDDVLSPQRDQNVVYMGAIAEWFDFEALGELAAAFASHKFIIAGPQRVAIPETLKCMDNVCFTGPLDYEVLPSLLARCSVGLIPFTLNAITHYVNPIKLFEYLAAGLNVVCSAMESVRTLDAPAYLYAEGRIADAFTQAQATINDKNHLAERQAYAEANSWSARFDEIVRKLDLQP